LKDGLLSGRPTVSRELESTMDLQAMLSDNQIAVLGCFAALAVCGGIAGLSFQFGTAGRKSSENTHSYDANRPIQGRIDGTASQQSADESRRAA